MNLRPFQKQLVSDIYQLWREGKRNVCAVLPTGGGKTFTFASILAEHQGMSCAIAHRKELVSQMSLSLARCGVPHRIIGPHSLVKFIMQEQLRELGTLYVNPNALCAVASVETLVNRAEQLKQWAQQVTLWIIDEVHHLTRETVWGKAVNLFPNARGLGVTATPMRADGKGLGRHALGVLDALAVGPNMRWLIEEGYLSDYRVYCQPSDINISNVPVTATGDFSKVKLVKAVHESHIVGDVVQHYQRLGQNKLAVVFNTDVETAASIAQQFNTSGVRAEVVTGNTPDALRFQIIRDFRNGIIKVLSSVDIFSEGTDIPAIFVAIFARHTASYGLFVQQFGRALRPIYAEGYDLSTREGRLAAIANGPKPYAIIIDHVGNVLRHGLPDAVREWSLDGRIKKPKAINDDVLDLKPCPECTRPYLRVMSRCPHCGWKPEPAGRSAPEFVDGDLLELDMETLNRMRGAVADIDGPATYTVQRMADAGAPAVAINSYRKQHEARQDAQAVLRSTMTWWAGHQKHLGRDDSEAYRRFYLTFGIDILSAQALGRPDALELTGKINEYLASTV